MTEPSLMPLPAHMQRAAGVYTLKPDTHVGYSHFHDERLDGAVARMLARLQSATGVPLTRHATDAAGAEILIDVAGPGGALQSLDEDESYALAITPTAVQLRAATVVGAMHGMETLLQLATVQDGAAVLPAVTIDDAPRFQWRGLMIDVSRHFEPVSVIERTLDGMAVVKLNVFHWHLSDDTGFRAESLIYPKLTGVGSNGEYYTQQQMRDVVAYARARGIRVVPEFDVPGHSLSWMAGYPELGSSPGPFQVPDAAGIHDEALDPTRESTYKFLDRFVGEMAAIFPDAYFHIGGDENEGKTWVANPKVVSFMKEKGFQKPSDLQAYFSQRMMKIVEKHGKKTIGWDEILVPGLPKNIMVQSWRGVESLSAGARDGYSGILSAPYYLDAMKSNETHFLADPVPADTTLTPEQQKRIIGGEVCMWAEQLDQRTIDSRIWPRTAVMAERFWSPQSDRDVASMYRRLPAISLALEQVGLTHITGPAMMRRNLTGKVDPERLTMLTDVLEPVDFHSRYEGQHTNGRTPLDRLVDAVVPDPPSRYEIARDVDAVLGKTADSTAAEARLIRLFSEWEHTAPGLAVMMQQNPRLSDAAVRATQLGELGVLGMAALERTSAGDAQQRQMDLLAEAAKPVGLVRFTFLDALRKLMEGKSPNTAPAP